MLAAWMGGRFYRTFRVAAGDEGAFDAVLAQRDRLIGVSVGVLWDDALPPAGAEMLSEWLTADAGADEAILDGAYAVWAPPRAIIPTAEPDASSLRVTLAGALRHLQPGEAREARIAVVVKLAKLDQEGAYVSVVGGMSPVWLALSEGMPGSFHLDSRPIHRLPEETAEVDILVSRVRDHAMILEVGELTDVHLHDHWIVSRLPDDAPHGVHVFAIPPDVDPTDGASIRRRFRAEVQRAVSQKQAGSADLSALAVVGPFGHLKEETVTASLRGMNPALYTALDLIVVVAAGSVRQVLQPRSLPWEPDRG
ncbi:MAG: hypothetical protein DWG80_03585 [Chloroflexi bacterium]|nr:hypothetical protein [Chloroflexota bacterium]MQC18141.1 hypothetical protein [Chloroflexota bacterium]